VLLPNSILFFKKDSSCPGHGGGVKSSVEAKKVPASRPGPNRRVRATVIEGVEGERLAAPKTYAYCEAPLRNLVTLIEKSSFLGGS
jgi:hypothetical protein